jgi:phosphatidylglycerol lysyltransferase
MRYLPEVASGAMDYLFAKLFADLREKGILYFDLGMAPLSNVGTSRKSFTQERVANLVYSFGDHFYSFTGLREFKDKYANFWIPKYNLYSRDNSLIYTMLQILIIDDNSAQGKVRWPLSRKIIRFFTKKD